MTHILKFNHLDRNDIAIAGGKGANLGELMQAGFPVPPGFVLSTAAYDAFVQEHDLQSRIVELASSVRAGDTRTAEAASEAIAALFLDAEMPGRIQEELLTAYAALAALEPAPADDSGDESAGEPTAAVSARSSATAEDLPEASFAGQQETFLNVRSGTALVEAVKRCWASLWTARAMTYRLRQGIDPSDVSLAVVVQRMVPADVSGILFTSNPTTGERTEMVINASYGLGEAIVSGSVTPDTFIVDRESGDITHTVVGSKELMVVSADGAARSAAQGVADGTSAGIATRTVTEEDRLEVSITPETVRALATMAADIEEHFDAPQDIEWAVAGDRLWILQSRPITNLPPAPLSDVVWEPPRPTGKLIRRQIVEHMPGPLSPLFDELYLGEGIERAIPGIIEDFGMAAFDIDSVVPPPFLVTVHGYAYSSAEYTLGPPLKFAKMIWQILPAYIKLVTTLTRTAVPRWRDERLPAYKAVIERWEGLNVAEAEDDQLWTGMRDLTAADAGYWFDVSVILGLSKVTDNFLNGVLQKLGEERGLTSGHFLRGFPSKTLEAQASLEAIARLLGASSDLRTLALKTSAADLLVALQDRPDAELVVEGIQAHIRDFGHQIYTLDFVEATQGEDSLPIMLGLKALVQTPADSVARQVGLSEERDALIESTASSLGPFARWRFKKLLGWAQKFAPYREPALFYVGAAWPILRRLARELGRRLVDDGAIGAPDDVYYLGMAEVEAAIAARAAGGPAPDYRDVAGERKALREARKRLSPPAKIPDVPFSFGPFKLTMFEPQTTVEDASGAMSGFAVSPGTVTAPATIVRSPADFDKLKPGDLLVCPTTTPAWTPLFSQAAGLVTEIGGILAHGSIVAREYGIPAVMGVQDATERIQDGQVITVDGDRGVVRVE